MYVIRLQLAHHGSCTVLSVDYMLFSLRGMTFAKSIYSSVKLAGNLKKEKSPQTLHIIEKRTGETWDFAAYLCFF